MQRWLSIRGSSFLSVTVRLTPSPPLWKSTSLSLVSSAVSAIHAEVRSGARCLSRLARSKQASNLVARRAPLASRWAHVAETFFSFWRVVPDPRSRSYPQTPSPSAPPLAPERRRPRRHSTPTRSASQFLVECQGVWHCMRVAVRFRLAPPYT